MRMRVVPVFLGFAILATPLPVSADPIAVIAAVRSVFADAAVVPQNPIRSPIFNQPVLTAGMELNTVNGSASSSTSLTSVIDPVTGQFSGHGGTSVSHSSTAFASGANAQADYGVAFELTEAQQFVLSATFLVSGVHASSRALWFVELFDYLPEVDTTPAFEFFGRESREVQATGLLLPGQYKFSFGSASSSFFAGVGGSSTAFTFNLSLADPAVAPTPEPASMVLIGTGLLGLLARRRLQNRHS